MAVSDDHEVRFRRGRGFPRWTEPPSLFRDPAPVVEHHELMAGSVVIAAVPFR